MLQPTAPSPVTRTDISAERAADVKLPPTSAAARIGHQRANLPVPQEVLGEGNETYCHKELRLFRKSPALNDIKDAF